MQMPAWCPLKVIGNLDFYNPMRSRLWFWNDRFIFNTTYNQVLLPFYKHFFPGISACFSLLSLSWTIVAYTKALRAAVSRRRKVSWPGITLQTIWRVGMVLGRITAIVLFATIYQEWSLLLLGRVIRLCSMGVLWMLLCFLFLWVTLGAPRLMGT